MSTARLYAGVRRAITTLWRACRDAYETRRAWRAHVRRLERIYG